MVPTQSPSGTSTTPESCRVAPFTSVTRKVLIDARGIYRNAAGVVLNWSERNVDPAVFGDFHPGLAVRGGGLEPPFLTKPDPKSGASTSSAIPA